MQWSGEEMQWKNYNPGTFELRNKLSSLNAIYTYK